MAAERRLSIAVRVLFAAYATAVCCWLLLGLLPSLAEIGPVDRAVTWSAQRGGFVSTLARRVSELESRSAMVAVPLGQAVVEYVFSVLNLALGLVLFARRPDELVPRLLAFALLGTAATFNMPSHRTFYLIDTPWPVQLVHFAIHVGSGVCYVWAVLLFPDGRWPHQVRLTSRTGWIVASLWTLAVAAISWRGSFLAHPQFFVIFFGVAVPVLGISAQVWRLRDEQVDEDGRAVARMLCAALLPSLTAAVLWLGGRGLWLLGVPDAATFCRWVEGLFPAVFAIIPVVLVAGVLRYRLWDIDRLLSRVLLYGALSLGAGGCYVVIVALVSRLGGDGLWPAVVAASVAVAVIEPLRVAVRRWANRVVFGQELSPIEATRSLITGLTRLNAGQEIDQLATVALTATRACDAAVWLDDHDRPVRLSHAGPDRANHPWDDEEWPIRYSGAVLGRLVLGVDAGERLPRDDRRTAARIADHAGLVLHNAQLTVRLVDRVAELSVRADTLRWARRRLVATQDEERYQLERDLHDGAQQALVAAVIGAGGRRAPMDPDTRTNLIEVLQVARRDLDDVLADVRPAALAHGLDRALQDAGALVEGSGLEVFVDQRGEASLDPEVETAIYYCCREALQNVVKHAHARHVWVQMSLGPVVTFSVSDDGCGLDPDAVIDGAGGLLQLGSRLAVLGGTLTVQSTPAGGVHVRGSVPAGAGVDSVANVEAPA